ncbi:MAG: adenylyltransferase/cytidyltransferase family protein [Patescibacteria group bacterium]
MQDRKITEIVGTEVSENSRLVEDHSELLSIISNLRSEGYSIGYTVGVWDMHHIGHARYLQKGKECTANFQNKPAILIVGIDSDEFTKSRKGPTRPIVPYEERWEMLAYNRSVNIITILNSSEEGNTLLHEMRPDVMILSYSSTKNDFKGYEKRMHEKYDPHCGKLEILVRQAVTSTSARISQIIIDGAKVLTEKMELVCEMLRETVASFSTSVKGDAE